MPKTRYHDHILTDVIPEDEPIFVIRAQDIIGGQVVRFWADTAEAAGAAPHMVQAARDHAKLMDEWPKKKIPDIPEIDVSER